MTANQIYYMFRKVYKPFYYYFNSFKISFKSISLHFLRFISNFI